jgi:hypothetical protein
VYLLLVLGEPSHRVAVQIHCLDHGGVNAAQLIKGVQLVVVDLMCVHNRHTRWGVSRSHGRGGGRRGGE